MGVGHCHVSVRLIGWGIWSVGWLADVELRANSHHPRGQGATGRFAGGTPRTHRSASVRRAHRRRIGKTAHSTRQPKASTTRPPSSLSLHLQ